MGAGLSFMVLVRGQTLTRRQKTGEENVARSPGYFHPPEFTLDGGSDGNQYQRNRTIHKDAGNVEGLARTWIFARNTNLVLMLSMLKRSDAGSTIHRIGVHLNGSEAVMKSSDLRASW